MNCIEAVCDPETECVLNGLEVNCTVLVCELEGNWLELACDGQRGILSWLISHELEWITY